MAGIGLALGATAALAQCPQLSVVPGCGYNGVYPSAERMVLWDPDGPGPRTEVVLISGVEIAGERACNGFATWDGTTLEPLPGTWTAQPGDLLIWQGRPLSTTGDWYLTRPIYSEPGAGVFEYVNGEWRHFGPADFTPLDAEIVVYNDELLASAPIARGASRLWRYAAGEWTLFDPARPDIGGDIVSYRDQLWCSFGHPVYRYSEGAWSQFDGPLFGYTSIMSRGPNLYFFGSGHMVGQSCWELAGTGDGFSFFDVSSRCGGLRLPTAAVPTTQGIICTWTPDIQALGPTTATVSVVERGIGNFTTCQGDARSTVDYLGETLVGGTFRSVGTEPVSGMAKYSFLGWETIIPGGSGELAALETTSQGFVGFFTHRTGTTTWKEVRRFENGHWSRLGSPVLTGAYGDSAAGVFEYNGELFAAWPELKRFDGADWVPAAAPVAGVVAAAGPFRGGVLLHVAGGAAIFRGTSVEPLPAVSANQLLVVGDTLYAASSNSVKLFQNNSWTMVGQAFDGPVFALVAQGHELFAFGGFSANAGSTMNGVARWDGTRWNAVGDGQRPIPNLDVRDALEFGGSVYATGMVEGAAYDRRTFAFKLYRVDTNGWTEIPEFAADEVAGMLRTEDAFFTFGDGLKDGRGGGGWLLRYGPGPNPCPADLDCTGGIDGDDIIAFFAAWESGAISADMNGDGDVDGDDVTGFFERWDVGC